MLQQEVQPKFLRSNRRTAGSGLIQHASRDYAPKTWANGALSEIMNGAHVHGKLHTRNAGTILLSSMAYIYLETLVPPGGNGREQFLPLQGMHSVGFNVELWCKKKHPVCSYQYTGLNAGNETNEHEIECDAVQFVRQNNSENEFDRFRTQVRRMEEYRH